jgi:hypothetical protein
MYTNHEKKKKKIIQNEARICTNLCGKPIWITCQDNLEMREGNPLHTRLRGGLDTTPKVTTSRFKKNAMLWIRIRTDPH